MHRDKKLGLALALLVIGIGTAFCFKQDLSRLSEGSFFEGAFTGGKPQSPVIQQQTPLPSRSRHSEDIASSRNDDRDPFDFSSSRDARSFESDRDQNDAFTRQVSQSHRSPDWNDSFDLAPNPDQSDRNQDRMANSSGREPSRNYYVPEHNSGWDSSLDNRRENSSRMDNLTARDDFNSSRDHGRHSPFNNEASFTAYPELLNESNDRTNSNRNDSNYDHMARQDIYQNQNHRNDVPRPRLNNSIVTMEEQFDPFGSADTSSTMNRDQQRQNRDWPSTSRSVSQSRSGSRPIEEQAIAPLSQDTLLIHEVRKAETLSGISARYLGSANKFMQIFEANRDVLKSPHDIRVGMKLRIPRMNSNSQAARSAPREIGARLDPQRISQSWRAEEVESLPEPYSPDRNQVPPPYNNSNREMFVPVRRSPFGN
ncbi:MAG: LysM peptidoglycan-binding domain-containing protein [Planctomycetaceae bacterium]|nr:LysM peptidoglycan-binding domain-containing protein [Planctomycetaceae bacterium]